MMNIYHQPSGALGRMFSSLVLVVAVFFPSCLTMPIAMAAPTLVKAKKPTSVELKLPPTLGKGDQLIRLSHRPVKLKQGETFTVTVYLIEDRVRPPAPGSQERKVDSITTDIGVIAYHPPPKEGQAQTLLLPVPAKLIENRESSYRLGFRMEPANVKGKVKKSTIEILDISFKKSTDKIEPPNEPEKGSAEAPKHGESR